MNLASRAGYRVARRAAVSYLDRRYVGMVGNARAEFFFQARVAHLLTYGWDRVLVSAARCRATRVGEQLGEMRRRSSEASPGGTVADMAIRSDDVSRKRLDPQHGEGLPGRVEYH